MTGYSEGFAPSEKDRWTRVGLCRNCTLRGQLEVAFPEGAAIDIAEVEPAANIVKRFATGNPQQHHHRIRFET